MGGPRHYRCDQPAAVETSLQKDDPLSEVPAVKVVRVLEKGRDLDEDEEKDHEDHDHHHDDDGDEKVTRA